MTDVCNNTSVGMIVSNHQGILLIERKKSPFGFAAPAGHVESGETFENAALRELKEEVGLEVKEMELLIEGRKENPCRRESGTWHYWKIYSCETTGEVERSTTETKKAVFLSKNEIQLLSIKTKKYLFGEITEENWRKDPGLEPIWYEWFKELKIIES